jgi:hypothetical protein
LILILIKIKQDVCQSVVEESLCVNVKLDYLTTKGFLHCAPITTIKYLNQKTGLQPVYFLKESNKPAFMPITKPPRPKQKLD